MLDKIRADSRAAMLKYRAEVLAGVRKLPTAPADAGRITIATHSDSATIAKQTPPQPSGWLADETIKTGHRLWKQFHTWSATGALADTPRYIASFRLLIPNFGCSCRNEFDSAIIQLTPRFSSLKERAQWSVDFHNAINRRLGKPEFGFPSAVKTYGWPTDWL